MGKEFYYLKSYPAFADNIFQNMTGPWVDIRNFFFFFFLRRGNLGIEKFGSYPNKLESDIVGVITKSKILTTWLSSSSGIWFQKTKAEVLARPVYFNISISTLILHDLLKGNIGLAINHVLSLIFPFFFLPL